MRNFLRQCLKDLQPLTGNRQLFFLETDPDGERKIEVCLAGMVAACKDYPYIPEDAQQKIIREQMVKDQQYEELNSRTIHKWLSQASRAYITHSQFSEDDLMPRDENGNIAPAAPPEVADKYLAKFQAELVKVGSPTRQPIKVTPRENYHPSTPAEEVTKKLLHSEYLRDKYKHEQNPANLDKSLKVIVPFMSEEDWRLQKLAE